MSKSISEKFKGIPTTAISDALNGMNNLDSSIKPVSSYLKLVGKAVTVKVRAADNKLVLKGIAEAEQGDVLVVDAKGYMNNAVAGDFVIGLASTLGLAGIVIDGVVRDIGAIKEMDFPVFCKGVTTAASDKRGSGEVNAPISCGDAVIHPGDIIIGDEDGVVCVPQEIAIEIFEKAQEKLKKDQQREEGVLNNPDAARAFIKKQLS
ncbi:RraA family protein [Bacillaceae bacterium IKA-2]|nr:RraA family protein [Bacillaceae bacterium IKA-2]